MIVTLRGSPPNFATASNSEAGDEPVSAASTTRADTVAAGSDSRRRRKAEAIESATGLHRPVAWIDDAFDASCTAWAAARPGPTLLVQTDPATGLREEHVTRLESWARRL